MGPIGADRPVVPMDAIKVPDMDWLKTFKDAATRQISQVKNVPQDISALSSRDALTLLKSQHYENELAKEKGKDPFFPDVKEESVSVEGSTYTVLTNGQRTFVLGAGCFQNGKVNEDLIKAILVEHSRTRSASPLGSPEIKSGKLTGLDSKDVEQATSAGQKVADSIGKECLEGVFLQKAPKYDQDFLTLLQQVSIACMYAQRSLEGRSVVPNPVGGKASLIGEEVIADLRDVEPDRGELGSTGGISEPSTADKERLGWPKSRKIPKEPFSEDWGLVVGGKKVIERLQILDTQARTKASVEQRMKDLQEPSKVAGTDISAQCESCQVMLKTLGREQPFLHATGLRELAEHNPDFSTWGFGEASNVVWHDLEGVPGTGILQFGALSDHRNSKVSLKVLERAVNGSENERRAAIMEIANARGEIFKEAWKRMNSSSRIGLFVTEEKLKLLHEEKTPVKERQEIIDRAVAVLETETKKALKVEKPSKEERATIVLWQRLKPLGYMASELDPENLPKTCVGRREIIRQQALFVIAEQITKAADEGALNPKEILHISHTSLLHSSPDRKRWAEGENIAHDEFRMVEDMEQIFAELGMEKKIQFEEPLSAAYIDKGGLIHLPRSKGVDEKTKEISVRLHYANVEAQGSLGRGGGMFQKEVDEGVLREMEEVLRITHESTNNVLEQFKGSDSTRREGFRERYLKAARRERAQGLYNKVKSTIGDGKFVPFDTAAHLIEAQKLLGWRVSTGCYSNKDRGGVAGRMVLADMLQYELEDEARFNEAIGDETARAAAKVQREQIKKLVGQSLAAIAPGSVQKKFIDFVVTKKQYILKTTPGGRQVLRALFPRFFVPKAEEASGEGGVEVHGLVSREGPLSEI